MTLREARRAVAKAKQATAALPTGSAQAPIQAKHPEAFVGKYKKRITFYGMNFDTQVAELSLLEEAARLIDPKLSVEDFVRGAALDVAVRMLVAAVEREKKQVAKNVAEPVHPGTSGAPVEGAESTQIEEQTGVSHEEKSVDTGNEEASGVSQEAVSEDPAGDQDG